MISETQGGPKSSRLLDLLEPVARCFMEQLAHQEAMPISQMSLEAARAYMQGSQRAPMEDSSVDVEATEIAGLRVCIVRQVGQRGDLPVLLYLHGGGWVLGGPETHAQIVHSLAHMAEAAVVVPDYALAPEHPYPAALNQCYAIAQHLVAAKPGSGIDGKRIAVAGDTAGGNLAAALALRAVQQGDVRFCLQALICPALWAHPSTKSYQDFCVGLNLTSEDMQWF